MLRNSILALRPARQGRARHGGGSIPQLDEVPAFELVAPEPSEIPVLIAVPHAGRRYPPALIERMRHPGHAALRLEDRLVDELGEAVAAATGASLLIAHAPRAMIDLNRAADDIDWDMVSGADHAAPAVSASSPSRRALSGLGLIPRRLPGIGELWKRRLDRADLEGRLRAVHGPYHAALSEALGRLRERWGAALLIDLHSMPTLSLRGPCPSPAFVVGDRFGSTCAGALVASAFAWFGAAGETAAHNRPYAGGYVLERHAAPKNNIHAFQLEVDRARYLDSRLAERGAGFERMVGLLTGLVRALAREVAEMGQACADAGWAEAAE